MSAGSIGQSSLPVPGFYNSPSILPAGLASGYSVPTAAAAARRSSYQSAYANLLQLDDAELIVVSLSSPDAAAANVSNVLAQASALQQQELAAQHQAQAAAANAVVPASPAVPTLASLIQQSDTAAHHDLANGTLGASVNTSA